MIVRSLDLLDLPSLPRLRRNVLPLDNIQLLTRGNPLGAVALLSYLNPRRHIYTAVAAKDDDMLMGQVILSGNETSARLTFLVPEENVDGLILPLLDHLSSQAGEWGASYLLAEVDEQSLIYRSLRQAGFTMYAWQKVWKLTATRPDVETSWREVTEDDLPFIQSLYGQIVPTLLQPVEKLPDRAEGLICGNKKNIHAHIRVVEGPVGIWLQPLIHPDSDCVPERISSLLHCLLRRTEHPIYLCVRSYQAWLESVLEDIGAEAGPRQAVMVKRLVAIVKEPQSILAVQKALRKPAARAARVTVEELKS